MYVKIQVMEERGKGQPKTAFKFVDMSSQGESGDSDKQNCSSHISRATPSQLLNQCRPCTNVDNSKLRTVTTHNKATPLKDLQFSTLSLDAPSLDYDQIGPNANGQLIDQNDQLNAANKALKRQLAAAESRNGELERAVTQLEQRCGLYHAQIGQLQRTSEKLQAQCAQMQKQYENKLLNFELPGSKTWVQETGRFYSQLSLKIKTLADKHLRELAKQKMNPVVQQIITAFITELLEMGLKPNSDRSEASNRFKTRGSNAMAYRSHRMAEISRTDRTAEAIGQDYRMLSKSIEKLKNMEKEIEESGGSFLRKKVEEEVSVLNGSVGLGQSVVGGLDRSKSRRKRIFQ